MDFLNYLLVDELGYIDVNIMTSLVKDNINYNEFLDKLSDNDNSDMHD